ncbi:MAG: sulfotransferase [Acidobacteriota bacterium]
MSHNVGAMSDGRRYLFLLGTMRSGSTLLASILCSHPGVLGYGETHVVYRSAADFGELEARVCRAHGIGPEQIGPRRVLDKLLHDGLLPDLRVFEGADLTCLFLLREPRRTIRSLLHQLGSTLDDAFAYYHARLASLERYARVFPRAAFLAYEDLAADPERTLAGLTAFLGLSPPLSAEYRLQPLHDVKGVGDRSEAIRAGRVLANPRELAVELPEDRVAEAVDAWRRCREALAPLALS